MNTGGSVKVRSSCWPALVPIIVIAFSSISFSACSGDEGERCRIVCPFDTTCVIGIWEKEDEGETESGPQQWCEKEDGTKHGKTVSWYENGQMREVGDYCDGVECGIWTSWHENGQKRGEGEYCYGQLCGLWTHWYENGHKSHEGHFNGGWCGQWTFWNEDGSFNYGWSEDDGFPCDNSCPWVCPDDTECIRGHWPPIDSVIGPALWCERNDRTKHGDYAGWYQTAQKGTQGEYCEGVLCGLWTWWWPHNNQKAEEGSYCDGKPCGLFTGWHENGQKSVEGEYSNSEQCGIWTYWDENGNLISEETYEPCS